MSVLFQVDIFFYVVMVDMINVAVSVVAQKASHKRKWTEQNGYMPYCPIHRHKHIYRSFLIEFYRIYRIYRFCGILFLVILKLKLTNNRILQIL